jgi:BioD-like phosphotransacetylase family protein
MTTAIYVTSTETYCGKSALCMGLLQRLHRDGFEIGYMKPVSTTAVRGVKGVVDEDAAFVKQAFELPDPVEALVPVVLSPQVVEDIVAGKPQPDHARVLIDAFEKVGEGRDVVLLEGAASLREGYIVNLSTPRICEILPVRELVLARYSSDLQVIDDLLTAKARFGDSLLGVVVNVVPRPRMEFAQTMIKPFLEKRGVQVLGILPQERLLLSMSVADLIEGLGGEILCCEDKKDELAEHLMVGAMSADAALTFFRRKPHKAVITGGDRADVQLAALETSTTCLILTGNLYPSPLVLSRADELGVPIILTKYDTLTTVEIVERHFGKGRFHQWKKMRRLEELLDEYFDFHTFYSELGLLGAAGGGG